MKTFLFLFLLSFSVKAQTILFMAGIEKDLSSQEQANILRKSLPKFKIICYKKNEVKKIIKDSRKDSTCKIVLFSAACKNAYEIVISTTAHVWIVEPHHSYVNQIKECVKIGFPKKQILLGPNPNRGFGILKGCMNTPKNLNHFQSLEYFSKYLN